MIEQYYGMEPYLQMSAEEKEALRDHYGKEQLIKEFIQLLQTYPLPHRDVTLKDAYEDFMVLKSIHWQSLVTEDEEIIARVAMPLDGKYRVIGTSTAGREASNYFHHINRWKAGSRHYLSPYEAWQDEKLMRKLAMSVIDGYEHDFIDKRVVRRNVGLRWYICSHFRPNVAKVIYDMFEAENVLDFSAGWGDRLAGFFAAEKTKLYVGIDPKKDNHPIYQRQIEHYQKWTGNQTSFFDLPEKRAEMMIECAEDADLSQYENQMDLIFTSPPYFDTERYADEEGQSWKEYDNIQSWLDGFLYATIDNIWPTLKPGGRLLINITDIYLGKDKGFKEICQPMVDYMKSKYSCKLSEIIGMRMSLRPNVQEKKDGLDTKFCEPIFLFIKE